MLQASCPFTAPNPKSKAVTSAMGRRNSVQSPLPEQRSLLSDPKDSRWPLEDLPKILIISLGDPKRIESLRRNLGPELCAISVVLPATDGRNLDVAAMEKSGEYKPVDKFNTLTQGQIGCFISHRRAWRFLAQHPTLQHILILEDDARVDQSPAAMQTLNRALKQLKRAKRDWEVLYLGRNPLLANVIKRPSPDLVVPGRTWGQFGDAVSRKGARRLLEASGVISEAADIFVSTTPMNRRYALTHDVITVWDDGVSSTQGRKVQIR